MLRYCCRNLTPVLVFIAATVGVLMFMFVLAGTALYWVFEYFDFLGL